MPNGLGLRMAAAIEATARHSASPVGKNVEEDEGAELEIEDEFRRKLAGLRRLPRHERPHALRAAKDTRLHALRILREKRAWARRAQRTLRRLKRLQPA